jgi:hypothetical protein
MEGYCGGVYLKHVVLALIVLASLVLLAQCLNLLLALGVTVGVGAHGLTQDARDLERLNVRGGHTGKDRLALPHVAIGLDLLLLQQAVEVAHGLVVQLLNLFAHLPPL